MKKILEKLGVHSREEFWALFWQFFKFGLVGLSSQQKFRLWLNRCRPRMLDSTADA